MRTSIEDLISRVTLLEQNQVTPDAAPKYILLDGVSVFVFSSGGDGLLDVG